MPSLSSHGSICNSPIGRGGVTVPDIGVTYLHLKIHFPLHKVGIKNAVPFFFRDGFVISSEGYAMECSFIIRKIISLPRNPPIVRENFTHMGRILLYDRLTIHEGKRLLL
jgi:hypothetical protein